MGESVTQRLRLWGRARRGGGAAGLLLALLVLVLIAQLVRLGFAILTPVGPLGSPSAVQITPLSPSDRAALFARVDPFYRSNAVANTGPGTVTSLPLQLFGIRINQAAGAGSAIIAGENGQQNSIGVGEEIQPGVRLVAVQFDYVEIDNAGKRELLYLDQSAPGAAPVAGVAPISAPSPATASSPSLSASPAIPISPRSLRAGISWTPRTEGNRVTGIAVREQGDGTAFLAAGFRANDIIRSINGRAINSPSDIAALTNQLRPGARLSLEVERGAGTVPIAITIPAGNP